MPSAATWTDPELSCPARESERQNNICNHFYVKSFPQLQMTCYKVDLQTRKQTYGYQKRKGGEGKTRGVWDEQIHTAQPIYKADKQGPTTQHMELCLVSCVNL